MNNLVFKSHTFTPIFINGLPFLGYPQIADALQYRNARIISDLYNRHADEFTPDMSFLTTVDTAGGKQQVRVFSLRGCHLLAMFSKTPVAKEFRRWVLDLIERHNQQIKPVTVSEHTRALPSGKKEIVLSEKAKEEVGGIVKAVVRSELNKLFSSSSDTAEPWEVSDTYLMQILHDWHLTRNKADVVKFQQLNEENEQLKRRLSAVKQAVI